MKWYSAYCFEVTVHRILVDSLLFKSCSELTLFLPILFYSLIVLFKGYIHQILIDLRFNNVEFQKASVVLGSKDEVTKRVSLNQKSGKNTKCIKILANNSNVNIRIPLRRTAVFLKLIKSLIHQIRISPFYPSKYFKCAGSMASTILDTPAL